tara:strand:- start:575 stop:2062 length:1488 start_codon:yes stop_codon:yes gene_type:complete
MPKTSPSKEPAITTGPYDSLREYMAAIEEHGNVLKIKEIDQDAYELTGLIYKLIDKHGWLGAPAIVVEKVKIDGRWMEGPIIVNQYGLAAHEAIAVGVPFKDIGNDQIENFKKALKLVMDLGQIQPVKPVEIEKHQAPAKEIMLQDEEINVLDFPFLQSNPGDNGRFINTGNLVLIDPEKGRNVGTYRMQIKGPRKIGINPERKQHGWEFLMGMKERGEKVAQAAVVLGTDPLVFAMSSSKTARLGQDELEIAGGFKGCPIEVVKCENSDITVPANVEMIIEGEIPLDDMEEEGPFGEMYGYMGLPHTEQFYMNIKTITHRKNPMFVNQFTGVTRGFITTPSEASSTRNFRQFIPELVGAHGPPDFTGFFFISIDKTRPHQAFEVAEKLNFLPISKIMVVVDKDVNIHDPMEMIATVGARWQPHPGGKIIEAGPGFFLDPSAKTRGRSSKIIIDATRQWPEEGGPDPYPKLNREHLLDHDPDIFALIKEKWDHLL